MSKAFDFMGGHAMVTQKDSKHFMLTMSVKDTETKPDTTVSVQGTNAPFSNESLLHPAEDIALLPLIGPHTLGVQPAPVQRPQVSLIVDEDSAEDDHALSVRITAEEAESLKELSRNLLFYAQKGGLQHIVDLLERDAEQQFSDFKRRIKDHTSSETQFMIASALNEIEARTEQYPLLSASAATNLLGEFQASNPSRVISQASQARRLFAFNFGDAKTVQVPAFQFDTKHLGVWKAVPELCQTLNGLNDWGVYQWLTSVSDDLGCTPAEALQKPELEADLLYLASLYKADSTFNDLSYTADTDASEIGGR
ncbi:hypothetical protein [Photobacterium sp. 1_MG-2023]|uniref:hypothetical protein n=1 Tax=Photobacterium sp. 1_MG-2023 TaxID=3062646 RepID=UPI0026E484C5|nr:hypothetical protein [Photobacterium sp. 1_MG-2023]MDO6706956.1 hypothetical protein [Photobacterium sp. 1_MG-2023]